MNSTFDLTGSINDLNRQSSIVWLCNIGAEKYWHRLPSAPVDLDEERLVNRVEEIGLLLCRKQDIMILRQQPDKFFLELLAEYGFEIPAILCPSHPDDFTPISELLLKDVVFAGKLKQLTDERSNPVFLPYGVTVLEEQLAANWQLPLAAPGAEIYTRVNDKIEIRRLAAECGITLPVGEICYSTAAIENVFSQLTSPAYGFKQVIIKEPHNASGRGLYIVSTSDECAKTIRRIKRFSRKIENPAWIVEGWYQKLADLNFQIYVSPGGETTLFSIKQQLLEGVVYKGSQWPPRLAEKLVKPYQSISQNIGNLLHKVNYYGVAGIDSIITTDENIFPLIEINGRFTLSTYISFIQHVLGRDLLYIARYYRVVVADKLDYEALYNLLVRAGLQYSPAEGKGIFIFNAAALPLHAIGDSATFNGRIFALSLGREWQQVYDGCRKFEELLSENTLYFH